ncbi:MAG: NTP transferase domain-containing protein [bacterium]
MPPGERPLAAAVLAAGKGKRMASPLAKVLHRVGGRPLIRHVVDAARAAGASPLSIVVGHQAGAVRAVFAGDAEDLRFPLQAEQLGTGHATSAALSALEETEGDLLLLCGDVPLLRAETLRDLVRRHRAAGAAATLLSMVLEDPSGYGRVVREGGEGKEGGPMSGVVEDKDASPAQRAIREVNSGAYVFDLAFLARVLPRLEAENVQGEYHLTDVISMAFEEGRRALALPVPDPEEVMGVNTPEDLALAEAVWARRGGGAAGA